MLGSLAESYLYSDSNSYLYKMGVFAETIVNYMFEMDGLPPPEIDNTPVNRIKILKRDVMPPREIGDILYALRTKRNEAVHEGYDSFEACKTLLKMAHSLAVQTYGNYAYEPTTLSPLF